MKMTTFFLVFCWNVNLWAQEEMPKEKESATQATQEKVTEKQAVQKQSESVQENRVTAMPAQTMEQHIITGNVALNWSLIRGISVTGYGLMLGGKYSYFFSPKVGAFIGLDYVQRNASENEWEYQLTSVDIPFGLAFKYRSWFDNSLGATFFGLYYHNPLEGNVEYKGDKIVVDGPPKRKIEGAGHLGFFLQSEMYFKVTENFSLGLFYGIKFGFADAITKVGTRKSKYNNSTMDMMFGLTTRF